MLRHSVEEKEENLKDVTTYDEEGCKKRLDKFESAIKKVWEDEEEEAEEGNDE